MILATYLMIENLKYVAGQRFRDAGQRFRDRGASATEYALIMGFIVAGLIAILVIFGPAVAGWFNRACTNINAAKTCQ
jgi:Flp pilus assembly pilin Flp